MKHWTDNIKIPIFIENTSIGVLLIMACEEKYYNYKRHYIALMIKLLNLVWLLINSLT